MRFFIGQFAALGQQEITGATLAIGISICISGCAVNSGVVPVGQNSFNIAHLKPEALSE